MTAQQMNDLCKQHGIPSEHHGEFLKLVKGVITDVAFRHALIGQNNYRKVYKEILTLLSAPVRASFCA